MYLGDLVEYGSTDAGLRRTARDAHARLRPRRVRMSPPESVMSLVPVPSEQQQPETTCANCDAPLLADQRYCLSCGQTGLAGAPRLPGRAPARGAAPGRPEPSGRLGTRRVRADALGYAPVQQQGAAGWLRRNAGLLGLLAVLALFLLAGLLVGHWVSESKTPANQTVKIEGLGGLAPAPPPAARAPTPRPARAAKLRRQRPRRPRRKKKTKRSASTKRPKRRRRRSPKRQQRRSTN